jgi:VPDSG-CTERM motif
VPRGTGCFNLNGWRERLALLTKNDTMKKFKQLWLNGRNRHLAFTSALAIGLAQSWRANANLVQNPGFETGDLTGWTFTPAASGSDQRVGGPAHTGQYAWQAGSVGGLDDYISQNLTTIPGDTYQIGYWLNTSTGANNQQGYYNFTSTFGATTLQNISPPVTGSSFGYTEFTFTQTATGSSTVLSFGIQALHGWYELDDVSVLDLGASTVPDGGLTIALFGIAVGGLALFRRRH